VHTYQKYFEKFDIQVGKIRHCFVSPKMMQDMVRDGTRCDIAEASTSNKGVLEVEVGPYRVAADEVGQNRVGVGQGRVGTGCGRDRAEDGAYTALAADGCVDWLIPLPPLPPLGSRRGGARDHGDHRTFRGNRCLIPHRRKSIQTSTR